MKSIIRLLGLLVCVLLPRSQAAELPKKPGPEHKKLEMLVGKWKIEGIDFASPFGPAGKFTGDEEDRMILGGFFLESKGQGIGPDGELFRLEILAYDPEKHHYQDSYFSSRGEFDAAWKVENAIFTIDGDKWNWSWAEEKEGKKYQNRQVIIFTPDRNSFSWETSYSEDGTTWKRRDEAKAVKVGDLKTKAQEEQARASAAASNPEQQLIKLEDEWNDAMVKRDLKTLEAMLADDYLFVDYTGEITPKTDYLANMKSGDDIVTAAASDQYRIRIYGDTALVTAHWKGAEMSKGKDLSGQYRYTDVWVRHGDNWRCVLTHDTKIQEK
jgi:ketosteroid isomerase-like protein